MDKVCRFCTLNCTTLQNIFAERERRNNEPLLTDMLISCTNCDIREADLLPQNICGPCTSSANIAFEFKLRSQQSHKYFTELLDECVKNGIKYEMDDICRCCNISCTTLQNIFADQERVDNETLLSILENTTSCEIKELDLLPQNICEPCTSAAKNAFLFQQISQESQKYFTEFLNQIDRKPDTEEFETAEWCITEVTTNEGCIKTEELETDEWCITEVTRNEGCINTEQNDTLGTIGTIETVNDDGTEVESSTTDETYEPNLSCTNKTTKTEKRPYKCGQCPSSFESKVSLERHLLVHSDQLPFKCKQCPYSSTTQFRLTRHLSFHSDTHPYKCEPCAVAFHRQNLLKSHMKHMHTQEKVKQDDQLKCKHCSYVSTTQRMLIRHLLIHLYPHPYKCDYCSIRFVSKYNLQCHTRLIHKKLLRNAKKAHKCPECFKRFETHIGLNIHLTTHKKKPKFKCLHCPKIFGIEIIFLRHVKRFHDEFKCKRCPFLGTSQVMLTNHLLLHNDKPHQCQLCTGGFRNISYLKRHMQLIHNQEIEIVKRDKKSFKCDKCPKSFKEQASLNSHLLRHSDKVSFNCEHCSDTFQKLYLLKRHMINMHKQPEKKSFKCDKCPISFKEQASLNTHLLRHAAKVSFNCEHCSVTFNKRYLLKSHMINMHKQPEKKSFKCDKCPRSFKGQVSLNTHLLRHAAKVSFNCEHCSVTFHKPYLLRRHMINMHKQPETHPYICQHCSIGFPKIYNLKRHIRFVHKKLVPLHKCPVCPKRFERHTELLNHLRTHKKQSKFICPYCAKTFGKGMIFLQHVKRVHEKLPIHVCSVCYQIFETKENLKEHRLHHTEELPYKCDQCPNSYATQAMLTKHSLIHLDTHPHKCELCSIGFPRNYNLQRHTRRVHQKVGTYKCDQCSHSYATQAMLSRHSLFHSDTPHKCELCSFGFLTNYNLQRHIRLVHNEVKIYKCDQCSFSCNYDQSLQKHLKMHSNINRLTCEQCQESFKTQRSLTRHLLIHSDKLPYNCEHCSFGFQKNYNLQRHIRLVHQKVDTFKCDQCDQSYSTRQSLKKHLLIHSDTHPFTCEHCAFAFPKLANLQRHLKRVHNMVVGFKCDHCPYSCNTQRGLDRHLKMHSHTDVLTREECQDSFQTPQLSKTHFDIHCDIKTEQDVTLSC